MKEPEPVTQISDARSIMAALERGPNRSTPRWPDLGTPVIDRGRYAIFPLAVAVVPDDGDAADPRLLLTLEQGLRMDCIHLYGGDFFHAESSVDLDEGYGRTLVDAGAVVLGPTWMLWWGIGEVAAVLVRSVTRERTQETLALHLVPRHWVWDSAPSPATKREASRRRRLRKERDAVAVADLVWSWPLPAE
ncbi:hypothetical protein Bcav_1110 [Beutenbergia cavernae DSM 12333]|uniref:Uncharacterized protein n=1 Tax=Beutenbergia cavernae (strain ATCC BAA-8 / DSM 12333 / CCUG 43141 / JCM 11478 / NBRC 16432 / NCIMB 13614 / HKI 0122) TaxID=471853 RepID=C5C0W6_BEUC1|nr:hypothetical protein [Beutenbergia cavernae]ACQ79370.1 hypothetical protein Bcav_1110 [Beutenbergia cavernae DSM 12333]